MARFLIISGLQIFPPLSGGHRRTAMIAEGLAQNGHEVRILSLIGRKAEMLKGAREELFQISRGLSEFVLRPKLLWAIAMLTYKLKLPPLWARFWFNKKRREQDEEWAEILIYDFPFVATKSKVKKLCVLNCHNVEHRLYPGKSYFKKQIASMVKAIEVRAAQNADFVTVSSEEERHFFQSFKRDNQIYLIPNCVDEKRFYEIRKHRSKIRQELGLTEDRIVLFFAASAYGPNQEGFLFLLNFARKFFDKLNKNKVTFLVCGSVTKDVIQESTIITTGPVPVIEPYFGAADWAVNPIFQGSGTSVKLAEMIACNLPVLTTKIGARGFGLVDGISAFFFDQDNLLEKISGLSSVTPEEQMSFAQRAREANLKYLRPDTAVQEFTTALFNDAASHNTKLKKAT